MKFSSKEDIEAPIDFVFDSVADFDAFERQALRRGADIQRTDALPKKGPGMSWRARFPFRGKERNTDAKLIGFDSPNGLTLVSDTGGLHGNVNVDLVALSARRTRLSIQLELKPNSFSARLLLQSLRLAKANLTRRFKNRVGSFAEHVEERFSRV